VAILLDTHSALWYSLGDSQLSATARTAIETESQARYVSPASYWELAIKIRMGRYSLKVPFVAFWHEAIQRCGFSILEIKINHASRVCDLPMVHRDPFDRMLVAQALCEGLPLVSNDLLLDGYKITRIW